MVNDIILLKKYSIILITCIIGIVSFSCSNYRLCSKKSKNNLENAFRCYNDSILFNYESNIVYRMDEEKVYPIPFSITLPNGIIDYYYLNSNEFVFYYKSKQVIYLSVDLRNQTKKVKTYYFPNKVEVDSLLSLLFFPDNSKIYNLEVKMDNRISIIIENDNFKILLANIKRKRYDDFLKIVSQSKFLN